ncbi:MAG TPA: type II toxin-antitoxin system VapB family antitoxin [Gemmatimonadota bacterium]|nr:type II toxin-antitoxin system VapB family antitoxin [Gemmatimonadota bacterium]
MTRWIKNRKTVFRALRDRLCRIRGRSRPGLLRKEMRAIRERCAVLPVLDASTPEEIIGYDDRGLPR